MAGVSFERYNLFPKTYGAVHLDFNEEVTRGSLNLYRTEVIGEDIDMGFDLVGARIDYDDRSFSQDTLRAEPFLAWTARRSAARRNGTGISHTQPIRHRRRSQCAAGAGRNRRH